MQIYAKSVNIVALDNDQVDVQIEGYDLGQILSEVSAENVLELLDYSDVVDFVGRIEREKREDADYE